MVSRCNVDPAAHAGLGADVAGGVGCKCDTGGCDVGAVGVVASRRRQGNQQGEESDEGDVRDDGRIHAGLRDKDVA